MASNDYRARHPIMVTEQAEVLDIPLAASARNLGRDYTARIAQYGAEARASGASMVEVLVPSGSANEIAASTVVPQIRAALVQGGVAQRNVQVRSYGVADARLSTPVRLSYARVKGATGLAAHGRTTSPAPSARTTTIMISAAQRSPILPPWSPIRRTSWDRARLGLRIRTGAGLCSRSTARASRRQRNTRKVPVPMSLAWATTDGMARRAA
ncbi:CpaD family pilus assembly lipoprotein [Pannonibacter sp. Pt2-lr]